MTLPTVRPRRACVAASLLLAACGHPAPAAQAAPARPAAAGVTPATAFVPSGPGATMYGRVRSARAPSDRLADQVAGVVREGLVPAAARELARDGRLDLVAFDLARYGPNPPRELVTFLTSHHGILEPEPVLLFLGVAPGGEPRLLERVRGQAGALPVDHADAHRFGVGVHRTPTLISVVVAIAEAGVELEPLPRSLPSGGTARVRGKLRPGLAEPQVIVAPPQGEVGTLRLLRLGAAFEATLRCSVHVDGAHQLEIAATDARGPRVLANAPVFCGTPPPASYAGPARATQSQPADPASAARALLRMLLAARAEAKLAPLAWDEALARVAEAHSQEMAAEGEIAHVSRRTGVVTDRLRNAGIRVEAAGENLGAGPTVEDVHRGLLGSPGHRANMLERGFARVGIGVAVRAMPDGRPQLFATQIYAR